MSVQATLQKQASKISDDLFAPYYEAARLLQDDHLIWDFICLARFLYVLLYSSRFLALRSGDSTLRGPTPPTV